ncbi:sensor histidine kinase / response regulator [Plesiocystis pacifica SIR-1]|uniref:histidine kinase n=1 Tax=Plesiocystis pacifica SIR-1 TaxID=391625 RepID=A6G8T2_9BACT|nr:ATP-binding protein [Plesiocystis pacifica]EDM77742.1 sensor histidine kinase / response regulator [Plesiocystis pacifica SIR-1]
MLPKLRTSGDGLGEVLLITGNASLDDAIEAVGQDVYAYVLKPFDPANLLATVGRALEKVRLQRDTRKLERRARIAEKLAAVGTLSAGLAHEIRNPLNAASLQLQLLERRVKKVSEDVKLLEPVGLVQAEIARLSNLVDEFLRFARPADLQLRPVHLDELIKRVVGLLTPEAERAGIDLFATLSPEVGAIEGDAAKLEQVLLNLVRNSIEALEVTGSEIELSTARGEGGMAELSIRDDGPGIPSEIVSRIFEPFFSTKPMGTGLGLAITHSLIQQHGGSIEVRCEEGTQILIRLPESDR